MKIVFVCTGNTCRSPMAEGFLKNIAAEKKIECEVCSAGVAASYGDAATPEAVEAMAGFGLDISAHRSQPITQELLEGDSVFVAMTQSHCALMRIYVSPQRVFLLGNGVPDPYGGTADDYIECAAQIKAAVDCFAECFFSDEIFIEEMTENTADDAAEIEKVCFSSPWSKQSLLDEVHNDDAWFYTASLHCRVVGYIGVITICGEGSIANVSVLPEFRRRGIASAMLKKIIALAKENKWEFLTLEVRKSNVAAVSLYEKYGFKPVGCRKKYYTKPDEDAILMTLMLENEL